MPPSLRLTLKESLELGGVRSSLYAGRRQMQGRGGLGQGLPSIYRLVSLNRRSCGTVQGVASKLLLVSGPLVHLLLPSCQHALCQRSAANNKSR